MTEDKRLGYCVPGCLDYQFDDEFWVSTMVTQWDLVCERKWLKTLAKLLLFTGFIEIFLFIFFFVDKLVKVQARYKLAMTHDNDGSDVKLNFDQIADIPV